MVFVYKRADKSVIVAHHIAQAQKDVDFGLNTVPFTEETGSLSQKLIQNQALKGFARVIGHRALQDAHRTERRECVEVRYNHRKCLLSAYLRDEVGV